MSARNYYIMQSAVAPMQSELPCYTPLTNHRTEVHAAPLVMAADYAALEAENARLRQQVAALQSDANSWQSGYDKGREDGAKAAEGWKAQHARDSAELRRLCSERDHLKACQENAQLHITGLVAERNAALRQRDKLAQVLGNVEREHEILRRMKNCEIHRGRGSFGIAVMSDPPALEWQALDKELQQFVDARRAALAASTGQEVES